MSSVILYVWRGKKAARDPSKLYSTTAFHDGTEPHIFLPGVGVRGEAAGERLALSALEEEEEEGGKRERARGEEVKESCWELRFPPDPSLDTRVAD